MSALDFTITLHDKVSGAADKAHHALGKLFSSVAGQVGIERLAEKGAEGLLELGKMAGEAAYEFVKFGIESSDAQRTLGLQMEALMGTSEAGKEVIDQIEKISASGIASAPALEKMARGLAAAGYKGEEMKGALEGIADASALMGEETGSAVTTLFEKIAAGGGKTKVAEKAIAKLGLAGALKPGVVTAEQLNKALNEKFGGGAKKMALGLKAQLAGLHAKFEQLFNGAAEGLEPLLSGLKDLLSIFDQNTASGKAIKELITEAFKAILAAAQKALPPIKAMLKGIIIGALEVAIMVKPAAKALGELFGGEPNDDILAFFSFMGETAVPVLAVLAVGVAAVIAGLIFLGAVVVTGATFIFMLIAAVIAFGAAVAFGIGKAVAWLTTLAAEAAGAAAGFISGLVDGITNGAMNVVNAVKGVANQALGAFKSTFGISSPSKVMAQMGKHMMTGLDMGIDANANGPSQALSSAINVAKPNAGAAGGPVTIEVGGINITIDGGDPDKIAPQIEAAIIQTFERVGIQLGGLAA